MSNNLIELQNVCAILGRTQVLDHVNLQLREGEILGLWGDNGSGKSALVSLLAGVHALSQGQILLDGKAYCPSSPSDAQRRGVQTIFQQPALLPNLSVAEKPACAGSMVWRLILPENTARSSSSRKMHRALLLTLPNASVNLESISHSCVCSANQKEIPLIPS